MHVAPQKSVQPFPNPKTKRLSVVTTWNIQHAMSEEYIRHRSTLARTCHPHGSLVIFCHLCLCYLSAASNCTVSSPVISLGFPSFLYCHRCRDVTQQYHHFVCEILQVGFMVGVTVVDRVPNYFVFSYRRLHTMSCVFSQRYYRGNFLSLSRQRLTRNCI